uniref:Uncharacterized protein n=1 Tax=viral metagenome TaxID=1070528 RepID=A0A6C0K2I5_9ZZZZ
MKIITDIDTRILSKDDNSIYNISDGEIIKYTGIYYLPDPNNSIPLEIEATFIGKIECERYRHTTGISGIYINPLYILYHDESSPGHKWHKIINYKLPEKKYFYYPHLLMLPETYYHFQPLYFFDTVEPVSLDEFEKNTPNMGEMELHYIYY